MAVDKQQNIVVKVTIPRELHSRLKAIAKSRGLPLSQLLLEAAIERYQSDLSELVRRSTPETAPEIVQEVSEER